MKVKLLTSRADAARAYNAGEEIEVPDAEAARMIEAGQAAPVRQEKRETAARKPRAEKAVK